MRMEEVTFLFYLRTSSSSAKLYVLELSHISKLPLGVMQREREGGRGREREREREIELVYFNVPLTA